MMRLLAFASVFASHLLLFGCGTETGNPEFLEFEYNATSSQPARVRLGPSEGGVSVENVWLRLGDVEFIDCDGESRGTLSGIGFADHGGEEAALQTLGLSDVPYCEIRTRLFSEPNPIVEPEPIAGSSVSVSGTLPDGRAFRLTSFTNLDLNVALDQATLPTEGAWLLAFDLAEWVDDMELEALVGDPVVIDAENRPELLEVFEDAVQRGSGVYGDLNGNGQVDDAEPRLSP